MHSEDLFKPKIIFDAEHLLNDENIFNSRHVIDSIDKYKITNISMEMDVVYIDFKMKESNSENTLELNNVANFSLGNIDYNNLYKMICSFTATAATIYSIKLNKKMFYIMIWDIHDKIMPKCKFVVEKAIIKGEGKLNIINEIK